MNCVVCKDDTSANEPLEHILPEGLGNKEHVLRRGVVCGRCNNYFARKVEKPFLELPSILALRFDQAVPSKRGLVPVQDGVLLQGLIHVQAIREPNNRETSILLPDEAGSHFKKLDKGTIVFPAISTLIEPSPIVARFLGKVGIEAFAYRMEQSDELLAEMVREHRLDALRDFVRWGKVKDWPISIRHIYTPDSVWQDDANAPYQIMHEFDFIALDDGEILFILALFGQEMVINMCRPSLGEWDKWLGQNGNVSPLRYGKNAEIDAPF